MNPPDQPSDTPRTDAAYFANGATMYSFAGEMKIIERELSAAKAECEQQRQRVTAACIALEGYERVDAELARLRSEVERLKALSDNTATAMQWAKEEFANTKARAERAELALAAAHKEIEVLRLWGNKDCTAMADAALKGIIP